MTQVIPVQYDMNNRRNICHCCIQHLLHAELQLSEYGPPTLAAGSAPHQARLSCTSTQKSPGSPAQLCNASQTAAFEFAVRVFFLLYTALSSF